DEAEVEVRVNKSAASGQYRLRMVANADREKGIPSASGLIDLTVVPQPHPALRLTVSEQVGLLQGGTNKFTVKLARAQRGDSVELHFQGAPRGVFLPIIEVADGQNEVELEA